ncbi:PD-(D/E)XK motif protein [Flindersiella endophytica]
MQGETSPGDWQRELRHIWPILRPTQGEPYALYPLDLHLAGGRPMLAVDQRGDHHMLVPTAPGQEIVEDLRSAHVRLTRRDLTVDSQLGRYVDVVCHRPDLNMLFDDILAAMLAALGSTPGPPAAVCGRVLSEWRELLRGSGQPMTEEAVRGLLAELLALERILNVDDGVPIRSTWTGPDRTPHDFQLGGHDLEVKALGPTAVEIEIHGLDQLDDLGRKLHLLLVRLRPHPDGIVLPDLVERIRSLCRDSAGLNEQLSKAGYSETDADRYRATAYRIEQILALDVADPFPRLTRRSLTGPLPEQVTRLHYRLDLVERLPNARTGEGLQALFERSAVR